MQIVIGADKYIVRQTCEATIAIGQRIRPAPEAPPSSCLCVVVSRLGNMEGMRLTISDRKIIPAQRSLSLPGRNLSIRNLKIEHVRKIPTRKISDKIR